MQYKKNNGWYIGWPASINTSSQDVFRYFAALKREIDFSLQAVEAQEPLESVFFEGGLSDQLQPLLDIASILISSGKIVPQTEVTVEVFSAAQTRMAWAKMRQHGITRISIAPAGCCQEYDQLEAVAQEASAVFGHIGIDLLLGCKRLESDGKLLEQLLKIPRLDHLTYSFTAGNSCQQPRAEGEYVAACEKLNVFLASYGFMRYTRYDFARTGGRSKMQEMYYDRRLYKGFGLGAASYDGEFRYKNFDLLSDYLMAVADCQEPIAMRERITPDIALMERILAGLATPEGVSYELLFAHKDLDEQQVKARVIAQLEKEGLVAQDEKRVWLTAAGHLVSQEIEALLV